MVKPFLVVGWLMFLAWAVSSDGKIAPEIFTGSAVIYLIFQVEALKKK